MIPAAFGATVPLTPLDAWLERALPAGDGTLPERILQAQLAELRRLLDYVRERSPFYAEYLAGRPLCLASPADLARLPFTEAGHLREWKKFLCVSHSEVRRVVTLDTSGTSGSPKRLAFTESDLAATRDFFRIGLSELVRPGERLGVLLPGGERPDGVADQLRQALNLRGAEVESLPAAVEEPEDMAAWVTKGKFHCLVALPGQLRALLSLLPKAPAPLRSVLSSADCLDPLFGGALRKAWGCDLRDHYGLTESAYGLGVECAAHDGYHLRSLDIFTEIVDVRTDAPLPPGETGEVVISTLRREAMPLVRYRTGDAACFLPGPCRCGSPMPRLGPIQGRIERALGGAFLVRPPKGRMGRAGRAAAPEQAALLRQAAATAPSRADIAPGGTP
ncbi:MAG: AMP-binding protein [Desulfovibrio sp.]|jgi:phenylacetate-coenzyme A ligase PaaK-like adenylate-forming protein|nr:AMP-binding protein [Desulfovibrio sp.]